MQTEACKIVRHVYTVGDLQERCVFGARQKERGNELLKLKTKQMTIDAMLAAVCVVLGIIGIDLGNNKLTFESLPILIAAMLYGPVDGIIVGGIGSFLTQCLTWGLMITTPIWMIPYIMLGLVAGLMAKKMNVIGNRKNAIIVAIVGEMVVLFFNTLAMYWDSIIMGYFSYAYIFGSLAIRVVIAVVKSVAYGLILAPLLKALVKAR